MLAELAAPGRSICQAAAGCNADERAKLCSSYLYQALPSLPLSRPSPRSSVAAREIDVVPLRIQSVLHPPFAMRSLFVSALALAGSVAARPNIGPWGRVCPVRANGHGRDDSLNILEAVNDCNHGGRVWFMPNTLYTIGKALDLSFMSDIDLGELLTPTRATRPGNDKLMLHFRHPGNY